MSRKMRRPLLASSQYLEGGVGIALPAQDGARQVDSNGWPASLRDEARASIDGDAVATYFYLRYHIACQYCSHGGQIKQEASCRGISRPVL